MNSLNADIFLPNQVRDAKIKFLSCLKQETEDQIKSWDELSDSLKVKVPLPSSFIVSMSELKLCEGEYGE